MQSQQSNEGPTLSEFPSDYELIDFGRGRKLESFGSVVLDRPCPAANCQVSIAKAWESAKLIFDPSPDRSGHWHCLQGENNPTDPWIVETNTSSACSQAGLIVSHAIPGCMKPNDRLLRLIVRPQTSGQVGLFPEHWQQWPWFSTQLERWRNRHSASANDASSASMLPSNFQPLPRVLHLFAYTGATTLALAAVGAEVTHVDAMRSAVDWARENCRASDMGSLPIRWIVDDARKYIDREQKRGKKYDLVLLDPPSYGHGASGEAWVIQRDLEPLLRRCAELISNQGIGIVLTGHSLDIDLQRLHHTVCETTKTFGKAVFETERSVLTDRSGKTLDCGYVVRFLTDSAYQSKPWR